MKPNSEPRIAFFAGSFDPFTAGHASVVDRALPLFDKIVIGIGVNAAKSADADTERRADAIRRLYAGTGGRVEVLVFSGSLAVEAARRAGARWLLRGVRSVKDFEYERDMADINRRLAGIETILMPALPELGAVSSSLVRELSAYGCDVTPFLPHNPGL